MTLKTACEKILKAIYASSQINPEKPNRCRKLHVVCCSTSSRFL